MEKKLTAEEAAIIDVLIDCIAEKKHFCLYIKSLDKPIEKIVEHYLMLQRKIKK